MKLDSLQVTNFRCFESLTVKFDSQLTVLVANNGKGKTAILESIVLGLGVFMSAIPVRKIVGKPFEDTDFRVYDNGDKPAYMRIFLETKEGMRWDKTEPRDKVTKTLRSIPQDVGKKEISDYARSAYEKWMEAENQFPLIAYYGTGRAVFTTPQRRRNFRKELVGEARLIDAYKDSLSANTNFRNFFEDFYILEDEERRSQKDRRDWDYQGFELVIIRNAISRMMPGFSNPRTKTRPLRFMIDWEHESRKQSLRLDQLSDGFRTSLAMIMDIALRLALLHSKAEAASPNVDAVLNAEGIVLIDEIDLHLHPSWQQTILPDLMRTFPGIQFIVTTHSPQVLTTVRRENIRVIGPNILNQIIAEPPQAMTYCQPSGDVMQSVMRVDPQPPGQDGEKADLERLTELVDQGCHDKDEARKLQRRLVIKLGEQHPQLQRLERSIKRQERIKNEEHKKRLQ